jgi:hypothetical protein
MASGNPDELINIASKKKRIQNLHGAQGDPRKIHQRRKLSQSANK